jgi:hypothetical protein
MVAGRAGSRTLLRVDYLVDENEERAKTEESLPGTSNEQAAAMAQPSEAATGAGAPVAEGASARVVDEFLVSLLPQDANTRRRVVTALLRAVLADRKVS